ncbi:MAG: hypothetical protein LBT79_04005 [Elusimicrobiota bacterium]|nr:hypothetical protein [Elusimicrobiota bacterium]
MEYKMEEYRIKNESKFLMVPNNESIESIESKVNSDEAYKGEGELLNEAIIKFPENKEREIVAMKVALIDVTNSTQIGMQKAIVPLHYIVEHILKIKDLDNRLQTKDSLLVKEIADIQGIDDGARNLFSFASKFCAYHNRFYGKDDFAIFDNVVSKILPFYLKAVNKNIIEKCREKMDYEKFVGYIDEFAQKYNITIKEKYKKIDHFLWYPNR